MPTPTAFTDPVQLDTAIEEYFQQCQASQQPYNLRSGDIRIRQKIPTMIGLAVHLGCSKDTLYSYINMEPKGQLGPAVTQTISDLLSRARDRIEDAVLHSALEGDADPKIAALVLYNHGYTTKGQEDTTVTVKVQASGGIDVDAWSK